MRYLQRLYSFALLFEDAIILLRDFPLLLRSSLGKLGQETLWLESDQAIWNWVRKPLRLDRLRLAAAGRVNENADQFIADGFVDNTRRRKNPLRRKTQITFWSPRFLDFLILSGQRCPWSSATQPQTRVRSCGATSVRRDVMELRMKLHCIELCRRSSFEAGGQFR